MNHVVVKLEWFKQTRALLAAGKKMRVRVGLFGSTAARTYVDKKGRTRKDSINNPTLGLVQEMGSIKHNIPARSFLWMPLVTRLQTKIDKIGRATWRALIDRRGLRFALGALGVQAEVVVQEAFDSRGFGSWAPNKPATIARKGSDKPLIESTQMRKAVTSKVV